MRRTITAVAAVAALATLTAEPHVARAAEPVMVDGSSTVCPITEAMAEELQKAEKGRPQVTVGISGTPIGSSR